jgi:hypothetical protein
MPYYGTPEWERGGIVRLFGMVREKSARDVILDDFHGDIIFYDSVNAPNGAIFAINFQEGTTSVFEADGTTTPIKRVMAYYKDTAGEPPAMGVRGPAAPEKQGFVGRLCLPTPLCRATVGDERRRREFASSIL